MPPPVNPPNRVDAYVASANQKDPFLLEYLRSINKLLGECH